MSKDSAQSTRNNKRKKALRVYIIFIHVLLLVLCFVAYDVHLVVSEDQARKIGLAKALEHCQANAEDKSKCGYLEFASLRPPEEAGHWEFRYYTRAGGEPYFYVVVFVNRIGETKSSTETRIGF